MHVVTEAPDVRERDARVDEHGLNVRNRGACLFPASKNSSIKLFMLNIRKMSLSLAHSYVLAVH